MTNRAEQADRHQTNEGVIDDASRQAEEGESDEPDAPTDAQENEGMSTILDAEPLTGVQDDASEE